MRRVASLLRSPRGLSLATQGVGAVFGFAGFALVARALAPAEFGVWVLYLTAAAFVDVLRSGLAQAALVRETAGLAGTKGAASAGAAWIVGAGASVVLAAVAGGGAMVGGGVWWALPAWALASLGHTVTGWEAQAQERFGRVLALRLALSATFVAAVLAWGGALTLPALAWTHAGLHLLVSLGAIASRWGRPWAVRTARRGDVARLLRFGRFSAATTLGAYLLRSADALILGAALGPGAVALYGVPQKLVEAAEVPVRGLGAAAYPALSRSARASDAAAFLSRLRRDVLGITALLIPGAALGWVFAAEATAFLGGAAYAEAAAPFRWFVLYALLLPADRFLGLALDALDRPHLNTAKVGAMLVANLAGDAAALALGFGVTGVAAVTVGMTAVGVAVGAALVARELGSGFGSAVPMFHPAASS